MKRISVTIDGLPVEVDEGTTILKAAEKLGIKIPTLCYCPDQKVKGNCRVCVVEVEGQGTLTASCCTPVSAGMKIMTNSKRVRDANRLVVEMLLANHNEDCTSCIRSRNCELLELSRRLNIDGKRLRKFVDMAESRTEDLPIVRDESKCIKCERCVDACIDIQGIGAIYMNGRGSDMKVSPAYGGRLDSVKCVYCGQCINACPVGAIHERDDTEKVWQALYDSKKHVVVQVAPAVRVSLGEEFGMNPGSIVTGKIVSFLKRIGFERVFDTNFTADLTIVEEGNELLYRMEHGGRLPMITSCSPGWIRFIELYYPEFLDNLSTCKSPQQMFGALAKSYYAEKIGIDPKDIVVVSIMPCTAKKAEADREEMKGDVDIVITTRELARMVRQSGIDFMRLDEEDFDEPFGISTGAGAIFGSSGGVMEAALRSVYEMVTGSKLHDLDFKDVRGIEGLKESVVDIGEMKLSVAVANSLKNAREIMERLKAGTCNYHFIEVMCCPGGCIGGGGQPIPGFGAIREKRMGSIYDIDKSSVLRSSHLNPVVNALYDEYLGSPLSEKSHKLLHTHYTDRSKF